MSLEVKRFPGGVLREFGHISSFIFKEGGMPFLLVEKYEIEIARRPFESYHLTRWPTTVIDKAVEKFFRYGRMNLIDKEQMFGQYPYIEIASHFNLTDYVIQMLQTGCSVPNLPLDKIRWRLNIIYRNYPKP